MTEPAVPPQTAVPPTGQPAPTTAPTTAPSAAPSTAPIAAGATAVTGGPPASPAQPLPPGHMATGPLPGRPPVVPPAAASSAARGRTGPMTRMGPWAPVAGAGLGLVAGLVAVLLLAGHAEGFADRLSLVLLVVGLTMLGAAGVLLADDVRLVRRNTRDGGVRPAWVEATAGLVNGLTPARLLLATSAFVLYLAAYTGR
jgi:hypothetical protein